MLKTKIPRKYMVCVIVLVLFGCMFATDFIVSKTYTITVQSISPQPSPADGKTPVTVLLKLEARGRAVKGHELYAIAKGGGSFSSGRVVTDAEGIARFTYYPYLSSAYLKAGDVPLEVIDESNSIFISVPVRCKFFVKLTEPQSSEDSDLDTSDIFGE